jgi:hypothetical protein
MTWVSGAMLGSPPPAVVARREAFAEAWRWHYASVTAALLYVLTGAWSWWFLFVGMTTLACLALERYARLVAVSARAYGGRRAY